ncbi:MAG: hypothetical protein LUO94_09765, partial [Methylococcaceae bacterium]|nr:hypothetical protein [Methylococcaceae bacterium]
RPSGGSRLSPQTETGLTGTCHAPANKNRLRGMVKDPHSLPPDNNRGLNPDDFNDAQLSKKEAQPMNIVPAHFTPQSTSDALWQPRQVFLFTGHMIDAPDRTPPRFPPDKEPIAAQKIAETLDELGADPQDMGLTQGACGGDILFAEACQRRGVKLQLLQPFEEPLFIENSVANGGESWLDRYHTIIQKLDTPPLAAPLELGPLAKEMDAYERCNLWLLASALAYGAEKVWFVCLWDGGGGDGPGGTAHMVEKVKMKNGRVIWLDTRKLW